MGVRGPKPGFKDVACPNKSCADYGKTENSNIVGNGTYQTKMVLFTNLFAEHALKVSLHIQTQYYTI